MNFQISIRASILVGAIFAASVTSAHDPREFDRMMGAAPTAIPTSCPELADRFNFSTDTSNPEIAVLKDYCDAQQKAEMKKATRAAAAKTAQASRKSTTPRPSLNTRPAPVKGIKGN